MELRNLKTFLYIVECESFTKAAEILGYTQSTVSAQIRQLETELGCQLFDRINHNITLTEKGQQLLKHALNIEHSVLDMLDSFKDDDEPEGVIRMISSDSICEKMMSLNYSEFYATYPKIKLIFSTANTNEMLRALNQHEADVLFTLDSHVFHPNYRIARESPVSLHFVTCASSPLAKRKNIDIHELVNERFLLTEAGMSYRKLLDDKLAEMSLNIDPVLEAGRTDILAKCVARGSGISFLPDFVTEKWVQEGTIARLDVDGFDLQIWKQLIYHKDKWISRSLEAFMNFVLAHEFLW